MKFLTKEDSVALMRKLRVPEYFIKHSIRMEESAMKLASKLINLGIKINLEFLSCLALLHDVGSYKICIENGYPLEKRGLHAPEGQIILEELGYPELAHCVGAHFLLDVDDDEAGALGWPIKVKLPDLVEGKVFVIADVLTGHRDIHHALECFEKEEMEIKYWNKCPALKEKTKNLFLKIIREFESYGWDGRF
ncbi:HD domain-containing protein [Candidatus Woesearchaeota archaeon]|nr:HD domain-containing protein [Candidatus Woesearchaeota archaeon]